MSNQYYAPPMPTVMVPEFPDHEAIVARMTTPPIFANDLNTDTREGQNILNSLLFTRYNGDVMTSVPTCACGLVNEGYRKGTLCKECGTRCLDILDKPVESDLWIYTPEGIEKFITPGVWAVLSRALTRSGWNLLEWLVVSSYPDPDPTKDMGKIVAGFSLTPKQRNLNFFYHNYEAILREYLTLAMLRKKPRNVPNMTDQDIINIYTDLSNGVIDGGWVLTNTPLSVKFPAETRLALFINKYGNQPNRLFSKYLPLPSGLGVILETNNTGTWMDTTMTLASDAMYAVTQMSLSLTPKRMHVKNKRAVTCTKKMAEYGKAFISLTAGSKEGTFRRHVYGGRLSFSMRAVIVSKNTKYAHDGLTIPWAQSVAVFRLDILNKLYKMGYTPRKAQKYIDDHINNYSDIISGIFDELLAESEGGIWVTFQRPPSLKKGSMELMRVDAICRDPSILTIFLPIDATNLMNADFDGDALHLWRVPDRKTVRRMWNLRPDRNVLSTSSPRTMSNAFQQQAPQVLTLYNYLYGDDKLKAQIDARINK